MKFIEPGTGEFTFFQSQGMWLNLSEPNGCASMRSPRRSCWSIIADLGLGVSTGSRKILYMGM